jgi:hypothetical protein
VKQLFWTKYIFFLAEEKKVNLYKVHELSDETSFYHNFDDTKYRKTSITLGHTVYYISWYIRIEFRNHPNSSKEMFPFPPEMSRRFCISRNSKNPISQPP